MTTSLRIIALFFIVLSFSSHGALEQICQEVTSVEGINNSPVLRQSPEGLWVARRFIDEEKITWGIERIHDGGQSWIYYQAHTINDFIVLDQSLWVLSGQSLVELDFHGAVLARYSLNHSSGASGRSLSTDGHSLFIAQGRAGLVRFDLHERVIIWRTMLAEVFRDGHRSFSTAAVPQGDFLYIVMTGASERGFNGVAMAKISDGQVVLSGEYDKRRSGVIYPLARAEFVGDDLVINNGGWIHVVTKAQIQGRRDIRPRWVAVRVGGRSNPHYMMLASNFLIEQRTLKACGYEFTHPTDGSRPQRISRLFEIRL
jgi:hypothetical protein